MRLLFDQSLPACLAERARAWAVAVEHVRGVDLAEASDEAVRAFASAEDFTIVSKGDDFVARALLEGFPPKVIHVRAGHASIDAIAQGLEAAQASLVAFDRDPTRSLLEVDLRRPEPVAKPGASGEETA